MQSLLESHGFTGNDVHQRSALRSREYGFVDLLGKLGFAHNHAASRSSQRLMRSRRHDVRIGHGRGMKPRRHQSRDMRDVHHHVCADLIGYLAYALEINYSRICTCSCQNELRLMRKRKLL